MRPSSLLAVAVSAVLGVALGIGGGLALDNGQATFPDPLALGIPFHNQPCADGKALLMVGRGDTASELAHGIAENPDQAKAYLNTQKSCRTTWTAVDRPARRYVVYDGPFDTNADACDAQFSGGHPGGVVTMLTEGTPDTVQCLCYVSLTRPTMQGGMSTDGSNGIWIRQLQSLLVDLGRATRQDINGTYDETTATKIREFQRDNRLPATGEVDAATWRSLLGKACAT